MRPPDFLEAEVGRDTNFPRPAHDTVGRTERRTDFLVSEEGKVILVREIGSRERYGQLIARKVIVQTGIEQAKVGQHELVVEVSGALDIVPPGVVEVETQRTTIGKRRLHRQRLEIERSAGYKIVFHEYDWSINEAD